MGVRYVFCAPFVPRRAQSHFGEQLELDLDLSLGFYQENITYSRNGLRYSHHQWRWTNDHT